MTFDLSNPMQLLSALLPELVLLVGAMILMVVASWRAESDAHQRTVGYGAVGVIVATIATLLFVTSRPDAVSVGAIAFDSLRLGVALVVMVAALGTVLLSIEYNSKNGIPQAEMHVLVLFAAAGMLVLAAARDLLLIFIGIEITSVASYVLVGLNRRSARAAEASLKYFLLGAFATAFLLYGMALIYGATGATQLSAIAQRIVDLALLRNPMLLAGIGLLTIGFAFKVAAAPFHMWAPDVYEGAPTPITAFMASAVKAAVFAAIGRLWFECFRLLVVAWGSPLWAIAATSMIVGNIIALRQKSVKRMLAYSSVVHSGYLLVTVMSNTVLGSAALIFYLLAYTLATFGALAVVAVVQGADDRDPQVSDFAGLWSRRPLLAVGMTVFLLALLGFPVFGGLGFFAKWYVVAAALSSPLNLNSLTVLLVVTSVISAGYYLAVVRSMFMQPRPDEAPAVPVTGPLTRVVLVGTAAAILAFGLVPSGIIRWATGGEPIAVNPANLDTKAFDTY